MQPSAVERLAALHPGTEIWWDSSPLIYAAWEKEQRSAWRDRPELLAALEALGGFDNPASGIVGCTTNPPLTWGAIEADPTTWDEWTRQRAAGAADVQEVVWALYQEVCRRGTAMLSAMFGASDRRYGHICGQVDPRSVTDCAAMVQQGQSLRALGDNVMIKMPATQEGVEGIRILSGMGISTNATLSFSVAQSIAVAEAARAGFAQARAAGIDLSGVRSCTTLMLGRMEDAPDFRRQAADLGIELSETDLRWAGVAMTRQAYRIFQARGYETKLLCASMRLGPTVDGQANVWHLEQLAGGDMVSTIFPNILAAFMETYADRELAPRIDEPVPAEVLDKLLRVPYFVQAYDENGVAPAEFANLPGARATAAQFVEAMDNIVGYVSRFM
jgi:transaldolase